MQRTTARLLVDEERNKQVAKGFTPEHDRNEHMDDAFLVRAGAALADSVACDEEGVEFDWPPFNWPQQWAGATAINLIAKSQIERLVIAAALLEAEIDRQLHNAGVGGAVVKVIHDPQACWLGQVGNAAGAPSKNSNAVCTGGDFCEKVLDQ